MNFPAFVRTDRPVREFRKRNKRTAKSLSNLYDGTINRTFVFLPPFVCVCICVVLVHLRTHVFTRWTERVPIGTRLEVMNGAKAVYIDRSLSRVFPSPPTPPPLLYAMSPGTCSPPTCRENTPGPPRRKKGLIGPPLDNGQMSAEEEMAATRKKTTRAVRFGGRLRGGGG